MKAAVSGFLAWLAITLLALMAAGSVVRAAVAEDNLTVAVWTLGAVVEAVLLVVAFWMLGEEMAE